MRRFARVVVAVLIVTCAPIAVVLTGPPAAAADCAQPGQDYKPVPWPQQMLAPGRVWPFTDGAGVTVAVLDSGVDAAQPRLSGHVSAGFDALAGSGSANTDCVGTGTQVAGVIAAAATTGSGFSGLAPGVSILPVRVAAHRVFAGGATADPNVLARGITWAVEHGAAIIDISRPSYTDSPTLRAAVAGALARQVVVVAAVGDLGGPSAGNPTPYPAGYGDGVLGVAAIAEDGVIWASSQFGPYVDLVAPGAAVVTTQRGGGLVSVDGTGVAAGFVAAAAALVRARLPNPGAAAIAGQLLTTATPAAAGPPSPEYGLGIVNPYAAVNDHVVQGGPTALPGLTATAGPATVEGNHRLAYLGVAAGLGLCVLVFAAAVVLPRGRRRRWRPATAAPPPHRAEPAEPSPPVALFEDPPPQSDRSRSGRTPSRPGGSR